MNYPSWAGNKNKYQRAHGLSSTKDDTDVKRIYKSFGGLVTGTEGVEESPSFVLEQGGGTSLEVNAPDFTIEPPKKRGRKPKVT